MSQRCRNGVARCRGSVTKMSQICRELSRQNSFVGTWEGAKSPLKNQRRILNGVFLCRTHWSLAPFSKHRTVVAFPLTRDPTGRRTYSRQLKRGAIRAACQRSTSKSLTAATASIQMDLAFVGGEGEQTKDLNPVLLAPLPDATTGRISSGRKLDYHATFWRTSERRVCGSHALAAPIDSPSQVPSGQFCRAPRCGCGRQPA